MSLTFYNTLTKKKEPFEPLDPKRVHMYNCGPTVYSYAHLGNFATFMLSDLLRRYLEYSGFEVLQVMNITDVGHLTDDAVADARGEDKLERKAREERKDPWEIARFYEAAFHRDRKILNIADAAHYPRATEHVPEMIVLIEELLAKGLAYLAGGQVYFEIARFPRYGILSGNTTAELLAGAGERVEEDPHKRNPLDFTLWKKDPHHLMQWDSPWGRGFPGWHIECSAMSRRYLGELFDIHTGGEDNIFPHHECEIAQSSGGVDRIFARYWLHRRHILVEGKKMSKSEGNFFTVGDLLERGFTGAEIRYALMSAHYRAQLNFTIEGRSHSRETSGLVAAREALRRLRDFQDDMKNRPVAEAPATVPPLPAPPEGEVEAIRRAASTADAAFRAALDDDLNISEALAAVFGFIREANKLARTRSAGAAAIERLLGWDRVLGVLSAPPGGGGPGEGGAAVKPGRLAPAEIDKLLAEREEARRAKDFARADAIRKRLTEAGITIKDSPGGPRWSYDIP